MNNDDLKQWRDSLGWSQKRAAEELGIAIVNYQNMERGIRFNDGKPSPIDRRTELACKYLSETNKSS